MRIETFLDFLRHDKIQRQFLYSIPEITTVHSQMINRGGKKLKAFGDPQADFHRTEIHVQVLSIALALTIHNKQL